MGKVGRGLDLDLPLPKMAVGYSVINIKTYLRSVRNPVILACDKFVPYHRDGKISRCSAQARPHSWVGG
jgi:hypothetical protein